MIEVGTILQNRYRIDKQIGQGGMGTVYVATDERFKSVVAIKETIFEDKNLRKAFEREARLLNSLKHSALPRVSDHFDENEGQFLVMEFISGEDLAEMMEKSGEAFPLETALTWAYQLCDALEYLHTQDIIHRDIKPQNLKLTTNGQIVLLDFGLAKGNPTDSQNQTAAKSIFGFSRNYASLEQIQGAGTEPRSDLYSLSATLYHLLTGIPPADALTRAMNVLNKKSDPLIPANLVNRKVPRGVAEVLQNSMALNGNERPESAAAMRQMLEESDKTIDLFVGDSVIEKSLSADFLTQETKIMGAETNARVNAQSKIKTKVVAAGASKENFYNTNIANNDVESKVTNIRAFSNTQSPRRAKTITAITLGGLVLVGSVFSAGYLFSPDTRQSDANIENTNSADTNKVFTIKTEEPIISNANAADAKMIAEKETPAENRTNNPVKQTETTIRNTAKESKRLAPVAQSAGKNSKAESDPENIVVNDETIEMGDMLIDENGIRSRKTGKPMIPINPMRPNIPPEQLKSMSPEQLRKLEEFERRFERRFERSKKRIIIKAPKPTPTP